jgi:hypothetical protein
MRKFFLIVVLVVPTVLSAQLFRIEFGYSLMVNTQDGKTYGIDPHHSPNVYNQYNIERKLWTSGFVATVYYPLNFGTCSFEKFSIGPQLGVVISQSSLYASNDENYRNIADKPTIKVPLMFSVRGGRMNANRDKKFGSAFAVGVEAIHLNAADETGNFLIPVIQFKAGIKLMVFTCNLYPMSIQSSYILDGHKIDRLNTKVLEFQILFGIDCFAKKYHVKKILAHE